MTIENIENHMAYTCQCGGVNFALLKSGAIECNKCNTSLYGVKWWAGGMGAQLARAIKAEDERDALMECRSCTCHPEDNPPVPCPKKYALHECMDSENYMRDAFENHWLKIRGKKKADRELVRHPLQPQCYVQDSANRHWVTWQASHAFTHGITQGGKV